MEKGCLIKVFPISETIRGQLFGFIVPCEGDVIDGREKGIVISPRLLVE